MNPSVAIIAVASSLATAAVAVPATYTICHTFTRTVTKVRVVPAKPKPRPVRIVYQDRLVSTGPCVPMALTTEPVQTTYAPLAFDAPSIAGIAVAPSLPIVPRITFGLPGVSAPPPLPASYVPEPSTWAMFIVGFGLIGGAMRSRKAVRA